MNSSVTYQLSHPATDAVDHAAATARSFIGAAHESVGRLRGEAPRLARWAGLIKKCLEAGASDYLAKPVNTEQLLSVLRMWLHR